MDAFEGSGTMKRIKTKAGPMKIHVLGNRTLEKRYPILETPEKSPLQGWTKL